MSLDDVNSPIVCIQHCKEWRILCLYHTQLEKCPSCGQSLSQTACYVPPFRLQSPLVFSIEYPCSIVIKLSKGSFLTDYSNGALLHIGITDSEGRVYDYSERGAGFYSNGWNQCVSVPVNIWDKLLWNTSLSRIHSSEEWTINKYHSENHNCFDFVLEFLRSAEASLNSQSLADKVTFCEHIIIPETVKAAKYISLYRQLIAEDIIVQAIR